MLKVGLRRAGGRLRPDVRGGLRRCEAACGPHGERWRHRGDQEPREASAPDVDSEDGLELRRPPDADGLRGVDDAGGRDVGGEGVLRDAGVGVRGFLREEAVRGSGRAGRVSEADLRDEDPWRADRRAHVHPRPRRVVPRRPQGWRSVHTGGEAGHRQDVAYACDAGEADGGGHPRQDLVAGDGPQGAGQEGDVRPRGAEAGREPDGARRLGRGLEGGEGEAGELGLLHRRSDVRP